MKLASIATAQPTHRLPQSAAAHLAQSINCRSPKQRRVLPALYRRSGVQQRSSVLLEEGADDIPVQTFYPPPEHDTDQGPTTLDRMRRYSREAPHLATRAAAAALDRAGVGGRNITHLVTVSCTGFEAPGFDITLIRKLGLPATVARTHIGFMGCHGALNGLRTAAAFVAADPDAVVLLCAVELCSLHFHYGWETEQIVANALFADGAAAVVCVRADPGHPAIEPCRRLQANGSYILPDSEDAMTWRIGNHGFVMTLSNRVPELISQYLRPWLKRWLAGHGLSPDQIGSWAIHPGGPRIVSTVSDALDLPNDATYISRRVLAEFGNMSSPTILFILERLHQAGDLGPCVALGFGPGLTAEVALLT